MTTLRSRFAVSLAGFGVLVATVGLSALLLGGCSTATAGAGFVGSSGLGYESSYPQASVELAGGERFAWRASARLAQAEKLETGDGYSYGGAALLGWQGERLRLLCGAAYSAQSTSAWSKDATYLRAELDWLPRGHELRLWHDWRAESIAGRPGGEVERVLGAGWRSTARWSPVVEAEHVWFRSWGAPMEGERYVAGIVYRFGGR